MLQTYEIHPLKGAGEKAADLHHSGESGDGKTKAKELHTSASSSLFEKSLPMRVSVQVNESGATVYILD